ncbi:MAG: hypothetical protein IPL78_00780 [Chloroflexi bacterium]|nr:hypothetical protein [Chloroflexota bacterium]
MVRTVATGRTCGGLAADLTGTSRVFASPCTDADLDYYTFQSGANQQLTLNYCSQPRQRHHHLVGANGEQDGSTPA